MSIFFIGLIANAVFNLDNVTIEKVISGNQIQVTRNGHKEIVYLHNVTPIHEPASRLCVESYMLKRKVSLVYLRKDRVIVFFNRLNMNDYLVKMRCVK